MFFDFIVNKKFVKKKARLIFLPAVLTAIILSICIISASIINEKKSRILIIDKNYFQGNDKESEIIKKYLGKNKFYIELPRENEPRIVKIRTESPKINLTSFFQNRKNNRELSLIAERSLSIETDDLIFLQNINFKNLLLQYQTLTGLPFIDILQIENLSVNFTAEQQKNFLELADNNIDLTIFPRNEKINNFNDFDYIGKIKFKNSKNLPEKITKFENVIKHILSVQLPIEKRKILPNGSYVNELIADAKKFVFLNKNASGKNIRYIQEDKLNFILAYYIKNNEIIFSNSLDRIENQNITDTDLNCEYPAAIVPAKFLNHSNFAKKILSNMINKRKKVIFIENQRLKELSLIFL